MRIEKSAAKERANLRKHGLDFSFADIVLADPLAVVVYDRFENGEHRWHAFAVVKTRLLLVVFTYPDPNDDERVRIIGLREATGRERRRFEEGNFD